MCVVGVTHKPPVIFYKIEQRLDKKIDEIALLIDLFVKYFKLIID